MRILCITPIGKVKTPETWFAELLAKHGHEVTLVFTGYDISKILLDQEVLNNEYDVIWGMMEYSIPTAVTYGKLLNIPVYGHIECIPPWRLGIEDNKQWGYDYPECLGELERTDAFKKLYKQIMFYFNQCDSRTISGDNWRYTFKALTGTEVDAKTRYYTFNKDATKQYENKDIFVHNQICTISRLIPLKRVHHIIRALAKIPKERRPIYKLIGYGSEENYLSKLALDLGVVVHFLGDGSNGIKEKTLQESMFNVQISSGVPILEAGAFKKHTISYDDPHMVEVYGDMCTWVERNNIDALAKEIDKFASNPELCKKKGIETYDNMMKLCDTNNFVKTVEGHLERAIKKWKI